MSDLKQCFESIGLENVRTYINSGNVLFSDEQHSKKELVGLIEKAITATSGLDIKVLVVTLEQLQNIVGLLPGKWKNDQTMKCDVFFVWPNIQTKTLADSLQADPDMEDILVNEMSVIWRIDRANQTKSKVPKIVGSSAYKHITIRNINTVRKLVDLSNN